MQENKGPQHIPLAVGLLDEKGQDLPLRLEGEAEPGGTTRLLELTEVEATFTFVGLDQQPVPSLLRGFSAPVILEDDAKPEKLNFLMAHDSDSFVRWDAGQTYASGLILDGVADEVQAKGLVQAFETVLEDGSLDQAFVAQILTLPAESYIAQKMDPIDVDHIHRSRRFLRVELGRSLEAHWLSLYRNLGTNEPYRFDGSSMARRSLKNLGLAYLMAAGSEEGQAACLAQFEQGNNMTDVLAALALLAESDHPKRDDVLKSFYERWTDEPLVIDKWFMLQAIPQRPQSLDDVLALKAHPAFKMTNPNRVRSLIGAFAMGNPTGFHRKDGEGYRFVAEQIMELDRLNPQIAARLLGVFGRWRRYDDDRQTLMKSAIERILAMPNLSRNSYEVASKSVV